MKRNDIVRTLLITVCILLVPLIAMQFSDEVDWKLSDFVIIGSLLIGGGLVYEFVSSKLSTHTQRVILGAVCILAILIIWAELAVGIFNTPFAGQ